jgi:hypothetical protein
MTWSGGVPQDEHVDVAAFVRDGYLAVRGAVDTGTAAACQELTWAAMARRGIGRDNRASWPTLAEGFTGLAGEPFVAAYMAPALTAAYDELIGPGRWRRAVDIGSAVVVRFPDEHDRANAGYHIEGSYAGRDGQGMVNIRSRARGLLALFLLTDVGPDDAPTRLMAGSHLYVPEFLAPTARLAPTRTACSGGSRCYAGPPCTPPARLAMSSCAIRSSCTRRPGRTGARGRG